MEMNVAMGGLFSPHPFTDRNKSENSENLNLLKNIGCALTTEGEALSNAVSLSIAYSNRMKYQDDLDEDDSSSSDDDNSYGEVISRFAT